MEFGHLNTVCDNSTAFTNLTISYAKQLHDASAVSASIIMFVVAVLFFILNLFSGLSDVSAILDPKIRVGLSSALSLFLPIMTYLFSEAKNSMGGANDPNSKTELPQRALFILIWMLLVELLRKKLEVIPMEGYSGTLERAGRVVWLGSLVYFNLQATGRKAMTGILWVLCAANLVQRISFTEIGKRSLAFGKNAMVISSYIPQVLGTEDDEKQGHRHCLRPEDTTDELLKRCKYVVMDEDKLVVEAIPSGYRIKELKEDSGHDVAATVGKIWKLGETDLLLASLDKEKRLRWMCLSFSLFKLLRRRFNHLPALTAVESRSYRQIIFRGLHDKDTLTAELFFDVTNDELNFLCEYYHSVVPVVLASPFFLLANYFLLPLIIFVLCFVHIVLCGNGDILFAFRSIYKDNHLTFFGVTEITKCLPLFFFKDRFMLFSLIDISITFLLFIMFIYEVLWDFFVFLLSDWFVVSLLCKYATDPLWHKSRAFFCWSLRSLLLARSLMHRPSIRFDQFSVLTFCGVTMPAHIPLKFPILVREIPVPNQVKQSISDYLTRLYDRDGNKALDAPTPGNGRSALVHAGCNRLFPFCKSESIAEVILTWHIATSLLEAERPPPRSDDVVVATTLSKYCAYLVAFQPELLPENPDSVARVFKALKLELFQILGPCGYYFSPCKKIRFNKIKSSSKLKGMEPADQAAAAEAAIAAATTVAVKGATLGSLLELEPAANVWKMLANLWVELIVYIAPSRDEETVRAHQSVLPKGGEFITVLWAMATHAGMSHLDNVVSIHHTDQEVSV